MALLGQVQSFKAKQSDVDRRLLIVTRSETSDDAVRKFDSSMKSLQRLDVAQGYVHLLAEVENLRYFSGWFNINLLPRLTFYIKL